MTFAQAHAHWRAEHSKFSFLHQHKDRWGVSTGPLTLRMDMMSFGGRILDAAGLPRTTRRDVLDDLVRTGRLYCACADPSMPMPENMTWLKFVSLGLPLYIEYLDSHFYDHAQYKHINNHCNRYVTAMRLRYALPPTSCGL